MYGTGKHRMIENLQYVLLRTLLGFDPIDKYSEPMHMLTTMHSPLFNKNNGAARKARRT